MGGERHYYSSTQTLVDWRLMAQRVLAGQRSKGVQVLVQYWPPA